MVSLLISSCFSLPAIADETCSMIDAAKDHSRRQGQIIEGVTGRIEDQDPLSDVRMLVERCLSAADHAPPNPIPSLSGLLGSLRNSLSDYACDVAGDIADRAREEVAGGLNQTVGPLEILGEFNGSDGITLDASGADIRSHIQNQAAILRQRASEYQDDLQ